MLRLKCFGILAIAALAARASYGTARPPWTPPATATPKPPPTATPLPPPLAETGGEIPQSLIGTWLSVERLQIPLAATKGATPQPPVVGNSLALLRIGYDGRHWRVEQLLPHMPPAVTRALADANAHRARFVPTADQLHAIAGAALKAPVIKFSGRITLFAAGHAPRTIGATSSPNVKLTLGFLGRGAHTALAGTTYEFTTVGTDTLSGRISHGMVSYTSQRMVFPLGVSGDCALFRVPAAAASPTPARKK